MWTFNAAFGRIFEIIFLPFRQASPWFGMILISLLTGLLMLFIFRHTSNQEGIRRTKNTIKARLLELRLYKDNMPVSLKAYGHILLANLKYLGHSIKPMLVMIVPILLILIQLNLWFGYRSLDVGQEAVLKIRLEETKNPLQTEIVIEPPAGISVETPALRIEELREIDWRLRALDKGVHAITLRRENQSFSKQVAVGQNRLSKISAVKAGSSFFDQTFNPGEKPLPKNMGIRSVEVAYPAPGMNLFGWHIHWLIVFFALSIIFGFGLKGFFKVEI
jgi:uncharacterized membrane protein (DUF106 family)